MGADLYINSLYEKNHKKYEPLFNTAAAKRDKLDAAGLKDEAKKVREEEVGKYYDLMFSEGYFRDSYNGLNILNKMDLSWWVDVPKLLNKNEDMVPTKIKEFKKLILTKELNLPTEEELKGDGCAIDEQNSVETWHKFFKDKRQKLLEFLDTAIKLKEKIRCSI